MGTISIWHWLIVLLILAAPIIAVGYARGSLTRSEFAVRFVISFTVMISVFAVAEEGYPVAFLLVIILNILLYRWTAMRLNDAQWTRWWALLWFLWPIGLIVSIVLCFKNTSTKEAVEVFE